METEDRPEMAGYTRDRRSLARRTETTPGASLIQPPRGHRKSQRESRGQSSEHAALIYGGRAVWFLTSRRVRRASAGAWRDSDSPCAAGARQDRGQFRLL